MTQSQIHVTHCEHAILQYKFRSPRLAMSKYIECTVCACVCAWSNVTSIKMGLGKWNCFDDTKYIETNHAIHLSQNHWDSIPEFNN